MSNRKKVYRKNVLAIVTDGKGLFLICERQDKKGAWQAPQGGIDEGEVAKEAVFRELEEETSLKKENIKLIGLYSCLLYTSDAADE